jgi:hypothetical protein
MQAQAGDELTVRGRHQGDEDRHGRVITLAEAGKLAAVHAVHPGVLSLSLGVPLDRAELRSAGPRGRPHRGGRKSSGCCGRRLKAVGCPAGVIGP